MTGNWMHLLLALLLWVASSAFAADKPQDEFARTIKVFLGMDFANDWDSLEKLPRMKWAPLPPTMLQNCLPDGGCFTRQGVAVMGAARVAVLATGARTIVTNAYFRNTAGPLGEPEIQAALRQAGFLTELVRCPIQAGTGGTNWYRLKAANANPGYLSIQTLCNGRPCEGFVLTPGENLPPLQPNQLKIYTEKCAATGADRTPVSSVLPNEQLARTLMALFPPSSGAASYDWKTLASLPTGVVWQPGGPKKGNLSFKNDLNSLIQSGNATLASREFSILASGTPTQAKIVYVEEARMHPRGEDVLAVLRGQGLQAKLTRCGPVYTESTNNWYAVSSPGTRPVTLRQSIRFEGSQAQDSYEVRLDASLPPRDPRDREPGVGGCR